MTAIPNKEWTLNPELSEAIMRALRHEVGDLLQTVYASVAILNQRLPEGWDLERRILADMRSRGEGCKKLLDQAHDVVCPVRLEYQAVDLSRLVGSLAVEAASQCAPRALHHEPGGPSWISGDPQWLECLGRLLFAHTCEAGQQIIFSKAAPDSLSGNVEWVLEYDGAQGFMEKGGDFPTWVCSQAARTRLGLLLAHKIVMLHNGNLKVMPRADGGWRIMVQIPALPGKTCA
jgi:hypothetical protein